MSEVANFGGDRAAFDTRDSHLASALMAVGVRPLGAEPVRVIVRPGGPEQFQFYFEPVSECGRYVTRELLRAWIEGEDWIAKNPDHPFAYAMLERFCYRVLVRFVKFGEAVFFSQCGPGFLLSGKPWGAGELCFSMDNSAASASGDVGVMRCGLVSSMCAVGVRPLGVDRSSGDAGKFSFRMNGWSEGGAFEARELIRIYDKGFSWLRGDSDDRFGFAMAAAGNHEGLMRFIKRRSPYAFLQRGKSVALLPLDATLKQEEEILGSFR